MSYQNRFAKAGTRPIAKDADMTDRTSLGDRMKAHEDTLRAILPLRTYSIIRVDGRAFHTLTRDMDRPFDYGFIDAMDFAAVSLCREIQGAVLGYVQSDEISVLVADIKPNAQPWFGGVVQKQVSIAASTASVAFNGYRPVERRQGTFDARVFTLPNADEVACYFIWRQRDAIRNSISMAAQANFGHSQLYRLNTAQMRELLMEEAGIDWEAYPAGTRLGRIVTRHSEMQQTAYTDKRTGKEESVEALRYSWEATPAPVFDFRSEGWLLGAIPAFQEGEG